MSEFFIDAPVIEVIVELRWVPTDAHGNLVGVPTALLQSGPLTEQTYEQFRSGMAEAGFTSVERLIPSGFPHPMHVPVLRYRRSPGETHPIAVQKGVGVVSVHALAPYGGWDDFLPAVRASIKALRATSSIANQNNLLQVSLRYVNVFRGKLMGGKSTFRFISDSLEMPLSLPPALQRVTNAQDPAKLNIEMSIPLDASRDLLMQLAPKGDEEDAVVWDLSIQTRPDFTAGSDLLIDVLNQSHTALRELFIGMTIKLHRSMEMARD